MWAIYLAETMEPMWTSENKKDLVSQCALLNEEFKAGAYVVQEFNDPHPPVGFRDKGNGE